MKIRAKEIIIEVPNGNENISISQFDSNTSVMRRYSDYKKAPVNSEVTCYFTSGRQRYNIQGVLNGVTTCGDGLLVSIGGVLMPDYGGESPIEIVAIDHVTEVEIGYTTTGDCAKDQYIRGRGIYLVGAEAPIEAEVSEERDGVHLSYGDWAKAPWGADVCGETYLGGTTLRFTGTFVSGDTRRRELMFDGELRQVDRRPRTHECALKSINHIDELKMGKGASPIRRAPSAGTALSTHNTAADEE